MDDENQSQENKNYSLRFFINVREKNADFHFFVDSQIIDVVREYTYLGTRMS